MPPVGSTRKTTARRNGSVPLEVAFSHLFFPPAFQRDIAGMGGLFGHRKPRAPARPLQLQPRGPWTQDTCIGHHQVVRRAT